MWFARALFPYRDPEFQDVGEDQKKEAGEEHGPDSLYYRDAGISDIPLRYLCNAASLTLVLKPA